MAQKCGHTISVSNLWLPATRSNSHAGSGGFFGHTPGVVHSASTTLFLANSGKPVYWTLVQYGGGV